MRTNFYASETVFLYFPPFINGTTGDYIIGTDTCTLTYKSPTGIIDTLAGTFDTDVNLWGVVLDNGTLFEAGEWRIEIVSNDSDALPQWYTFYWGGKSDITSNTRKILTNRWKVDPTSKTFTIYDDDGVTPLYVFDVKDETGAASGYRIFERVPQ